MYIFIYLIEPLHKKFGFDIRQFRNNYDKEDDALRADVGYGIHLLLLGCFLISKIRAQCQKIYTLNPITKDDVK